MAGGGSLSGTFTTSDGTTGTYVETKTTVDAVTTDTVVLTASDRRRSAVTRPPPPSTPTARGRSFTRDLALGGTVPTVLSLTLPAVTTSTTRKRRSAATPA